MNRKERNTLRRNRFNGASFSVRMDRMINSIERTTQWTTLDKKPVILNRYNDGDKVYQPWAVKRHIVKAPGSKLILPK